MRHTTRTILSTLFLTALGAAGCTSTHSGGETCGSTTCGSNQYCCCNVCIGELGSCAGDCAVDAGTDDAGVGLDASGPNRCLDNAECGAGNYCVKHNGCNTVGNCVARPTACTEEYAPVCGCDGQTYDNACFAAGAGVNVERAGECERTFACGTRGGITCAEDEFCFLDRDPHCGANDGGGTCITPPTACDGEYAPVCSCDGVTYGNDCEARAASRSIRHDGECGGPEVCGPQDIAIVDPSCDERFVYWDGTRCVEASGCCEGSDCGAGYFSLTLCREARRECDRYCGGWVGDTCLESEFCDFAEPGCDWADASGICRPRPVDCPDPGGVPTCGCDGQTYISECSANLAGTDSAGPGGCLVPG